MRILLLTAGADSQASRMGRAAAMLAARGHAVQVQEGAGPRGTRARPAHADVVVGCGTSPLRTALAGRRAHAHAMVLSVTPREFGAWGLLDRLAWQSLYALGLVEEGDADAVRAAAGDAGLEHFGLWSSAPVPPEPDVSHADVDVLERACERALARHRGRALRAAVFMDRDGTLVRERGYLADPDELELLPGVPGALQNLRAAGFALIVISNQSGVGRGLFPLTRVHEAMARLRRLLRDHGVELDAIYFCPHRPDEGCTCRKPGPGLLERAAVDQGLALGRSVMIGDKLIDAEAGRRSGGRGVLVRTGYGADEERRRGSVPAESAPDRVCDDFVAAAKWVIAEEDGIESGRRSPVTQ